MANVIERYVSVLMRRRRAVLVVLFAVTLLVGSGATGIDSDLTVAQFDIESDAVDDRAYVEEQFATGSETVSVVVVRDENVLSQESLAATMALHETIRENETVGPTLTETRPTIDTATVFTESVLRSLGSFGTLTLDDKARTFGTFTAEEIETELPETLEDDRPIFGPGTRVSTLLPTDYDGSAQAETRLLLVRHDEIDDDELLAAQRALEPLVEEHVGNDSFVFGEALVEQRASDATAAAFAVLGPLVLVLVVGLLALAYRDLLDVVLGVFGIGVVLLWTAGFVGWTGVEVTQLLVAVPWLLLGLAIDYGLHVVMRSREAWEAGESTTRAMSVGLAGVLVALGVTTLTTASGFLSGVYGPAPIRDFGVVAAFGIFAALVIFGAFVPALKVELENRLGREGGRRSIGRIRPVERIVRFGVIGATRAPVVVVVVALLLAGGGFYGGTQVDTSVDRTDFYPDEPPAWLSSVPGVETDEQTETLRDQATFLDERFAVADGSERVDVLVRGAVTNESGVSAIHTIERESSALDFVRTANDEPDIYTPFSVVDRFEPFDDRITDALEAADTTGDGQPDGDVTAVFDSTREVGEDELSAVVYRDDTGEYRAVRVVVPVERGAYTQTVATEIRSVATIADENPGVTVTVTGEPIVTADRQEALLSLLVQSFIITLSLTFALLIALFWYRYRSLTLGLATVIPVLCALSWVLGTMYLTGLPYNAETAIITGIAIGLGVDYAIHVSARFQQEYTGAEGRPDSDAEGELTSALSRAVEDTGGTLFASAATTAVGVGVLLFTFIPSLQRFGLVMVLTVVYAFFVSVFVLPSLLALQARLGS